MTSHIWAIADLHLAFSCPEKKMDVFGPAWVEHHKKVEEHWKACISSKDLVLIPGDITWALKLHQALEDLAWIDSLPGTKLLLKGNHDYWWPSKAKLTKALPSSMHALHNDQFFWKGVGIGGVRLWDSSEYHFSPFTEKEVPAPILSEEDLKEQERIFSRELQRLERSLQGLDESEVKIALTHYPPIGADLAPSRVSNIFEQYGVEIALFGHLHGIKKGALPFGKARGVDYHLVSTDYLEHKPKKIITLP